MARRETTQGENAAREFLNDFPCLKAGMDPVQTLRERGVAVHLKPMPSDVSGVLARRSGRLVVVINESHNALRQRFTAAHELGHVIMHVDRFEDTHVDTIIKSRDRLSSKGEEPEEVEANAFAAEFLMPRSLLLHDMPEGYGDPYDVDEEVIAKIARRYKVSRTAMTYRLMNLGLIGGSFWR